MIEFAAKLQGISPSEIKSSDTKPTNATEEESKDEVAASATDGETRIKTIRECCIITTRINSVVSRRGEETEWEGYFFADKIDSNFASIFFVTA